MTMVDAKIISRQIFILVLRVDVGCRIWIGKTDGRGVGTEQEGLVDLSQGNIVFEDICIIFLVDVDFRHGARVLVGRLKTKAALNKLNYETPVN